MLIYFVRHGETEWNKKGIIQGHKDSPLTQKGKITAKKQAKILKDKNIEIIYTSDLGRCVQTAGIINKKIEVKIIKTRQLRERNFGLLNGKPAKEIRKKLNLSDSDEVAPKGESFNQMKERVLDFIKLLTRKKQNNVLLITHDGATSAILCDYYKAKFESKKCRANEDYVYSLKVEENIKQLEKFKLDKKY